MFPLKLFFDVLMGYRRRKIILLIDEVLKWVFQQNCKFVKIQPLVFKIKILTMSNIRIDHISNGTMR
jgi:hypothetical protein